MPIPRRSGGTTMRSSADERTRPPSTIRPVVGDTKPAIILSVVVLPQPDGPRSVRNSPSRIASERSRTAHTAVASGDRRGGSNDFPTRSNRRSATGRSGRAAQHGPRGEVDGEQQHRHKERQRGGERDLPLVVQPEDDNAQGLRSE